LVKRRETKNKGEGNILEENEEIKRNNPTKQRKKGNFLFLPKEENNEDTR
jgi:hypothetical protein